MVASSFGTGGAVTAGSGWATAATRTRMAAVRCVDWRIAELPFIASLDNGREARVEARRLASAPPFPLQSKALGAGGSIKTRSLVAFGLALAPALSSATSIPLTVLTEDAAPRDPARLARRRGARPRRPRDRGLRREPAQRSRGRRGHAHLRRGARSASTTRRAWPRWAATCGCSPRPSLLRGRPLARPRRLAAAPPRPAPRQAGGVARDGSRCWWWATVSRAAGRR